ncbi:MAG: DUF4469 domain-containing protein [Chthoniobacteraceae bacterium]
MQNLFWDMINPLTGTAFRLDDVNVFFDLNGIGKYLEPGDPGFVPYANQLPPPPPKPKPKPFHRAPKQPAATSSSSTAAHITMSTFQYNVVPKSGGGFSTRPVLAAEFDDATIDAAVSSATGVPADKCLAVLTGYLDQFLQQASGCGWSHAFHDLLSVRPTSGGSETAPDGFHTPADLNPGVSLSISPTRLDAWRSTLSIQSMGQVGLLSPHVDSIINLHDGTEDTYTPGEIIQLSGDHLGFDKTDTAQGVFYATAAAPGTKVRIASYGPINPGQINAIIPAGLTGALTISVVTKPSNSLRSTTYLHPIG